RHGVDGAARHVPSVAFLAARGRSAEDERVLCPTYFHLERTVGLVETELLSALRLDGPDFAERHQRRELLRELIGRLHADETERRPLSRRRRTGVGCRRVVMGALFLVDLGDVVAPLAVLLGLEHDGALRRLE